MTSTSRPLAGLATQVQTNGPYGGMKAFTLFGLTRALGQINSVRPLKQSSKSSRGVELMVPTASTNGQLLFPGAFPCVTSYLYIFQNV